MRILGCLVVLNFCALTLIPVNAQNVEWNISGPELVWKLYDAEEAISQVRGMALTGDGEFIMAMDRAYDETGEIDAYKWGWEVQDEIKIEIDIVIMKIDNNGWLTWESHIGEDGIQDLVGCILQSGDGFIVGGIKRGASAHLGGWGLQAYLVRVGPDGSILWEKTYGSNSPKDRYELVPARGDGVGAVTVVALDKDEVLAAWAEQISGNEAVYLRVLRIDGEGRTIWDKTYDLGSEFQLGASGTGFISSITGGIGGIVVSDQRLGTFIVNVHGERVWNSTRKIASAIGTDTGYVVTNSWSTVMIDVEGNTVWEKPYGGGYLAESSDGGYVVTGASTFKIDANGKKVWEKDVFVGGSITASGDEGYIINYHLSEDLRGILKTDARGEKVWDKEYSWGYLSEYDRWNREWDQHPPQIIVTGDGGVALFGTTYGDPRIQRLDAEGEEIWNYFYGSTEMINDVAASVDGGCVVAGWTQLYGAGTRDAYLSRIHQDGYKIWENSYGGERWDSAECIVPSGNGFAVAGYSSSFGKGDRDIYIFMIDGEGNKIWERTHGTSEDDWVEDILRTEDGGFLVTGNTESPEHGTSQIYIFKTNNNGEKIWERNYDLSERAYARSVESIQDEGFIVTGEIHFGQGKKDQLLMRIDGRGQLVWVRTFRCPALRGCPGAWIRKIPGEGFITGSVRDNEFYMVKIDGAGNKVWESTDTSCYSAFSVAAVTCDGGFIVVNGEGWSWPDPPRKAVFRRFDDEGNIVWKTGLESMVNASNYWELETEYEPRGIAQIGRGTFVVAGNTFAEPFWVNFIPQPYIIVFKDPSLVGIECPEIYTLAALLLLVPIFWALAANTAKQETK